MPSISQQEYIHIVMGCTSDSPSETSQENKKKLALMIKDGTIYDAILHFTDTEFCTAIVLHAVINEGEYEISYWSFAMETENLFTFTL